MLTRAWPVILLILLSLPVVLPLFGPGFPNTHDGETFVARFASFDQSLREGELFPRWADNLAFNLGTPVLMLYAILPLYLAEIPKVLGASYSFAIEIILASSIIFSGVAFYLWMKDVFGKVAGFMGALFYVWAPYRLLDLYVRGEIAESLALVFPPLILLSIKKIIDGCGKRWFLLGVLELSALVTAHIGIALMFAPVFVVYSLLFGKAVGKLRNLKLVFLLFATAALLSAFYWLPAYLEKGYTNIDLQNQRASYRTNFITPNQIIYSRWGWGPLDSNSPMSLQLGLVHLLSLVLTVSFVTLVYFKDNPFVKRVWQFLQNLHLFLISGFTKSDYLYFSLFFTILLVSLYLSTSYSLPLWENLSLLSILLFPWRFMILAVFATSVLTAFLFYLMKDNKLFILLFIPLLLYANRNHLQLVGVSFHDDVFYTNFLDTTDIWGETLPKDADLTVVQKCRLENCTFPKVVVLEGTTLQVTKKTNHQLEFSLAGQNNSTITVNTFYFPGWEVMVDGKRQEVEMNKLGTMDFQVPSGQHQVVIRFQDTGLRKVSIYISLVGLAVLIIVLCKKKSFSA